MTRILPVFACLVGLLGPRGLAGQGVEEILSFDVRIDVQPGGLMVVTEEITVRALGREIRRGIYRDFPTSFPRQIGLGRIEAPFSVHSVTRDGAAEPYSLQSTGGPAGRGGMRIPHWRRRRRSQSGYLPLHHRIRDPALDHDRRNRGPAVLERDRQRVGLPHPVGDGSYSDSRTRSSAHTRVVDRPGGVDGDQRAVAVGRRGEGGRVPHG